MPARAPRNSANPTIASAATPCIAAHNAVARGSTGAPGLRGGRRITSFSSVSDSKTTEQAGSITISSKRDLHRHQHQRQAEQEGQQRQSRNRNMHRHDILMALRRLS